MSSELSNTQASESNDIVDALFHYESRIHDLPVHWAWGIGKASIDELYLEDGEIFSATGQCCIQN